MAQHTIPVGRRPRPSALRNRRGAAFLLAVYITSLAFLLLSGVALQRTNTELRAAQASRDVQQAFWLAEAGLDKALQTTRSQYGAIQNNTSYTGSTPTGSYTYQVTTRSSSIGLGGVYELVQDITATGTDTDGRPTTLTATVRTQQTFSGVVANGSIVAYDRDWTARDGDITIDGDITVASGQRESVILDEGVTLDGNVTVNLPDPVAQGGYEALMGYFGEKGSPAVLLARNTGSDVYTTVKDSSIIGTPRQQTVVPWQAATQRDRCSRTALIVPEGTIRHIADGDPLDLTPAGDGQVVMCVPGVGVADRADLVFDDRTLLYVDPYVAKQVLPSSSIEFSQPTASVPFTNDGTIYVRYTPSKNPDRGLTVVIPTKLGQDVRYVPPTSVYLGKFEGSIYAPNSFVELGPSIREEWGCETCNYGYAASTRTIGFVVAKDIDMLGVDINFRHAYAQSQPLITQTSVASWTTRTPPPAPTTCTTTTITSGKTQTKSCI